MKRRKLRKTGENIQNALEVPNDGNKIFFKICKHKKGKRKRENNKPTIEKEEAGNRGHYKLRNVNIKAFGDIPNSFNHGSCFVSFFLNPVAMLEL